MIGWLSGTGKLTGQLTGFFCRIVPVGQGGEVLTDVAVGLWMGWRLRRWFFL